MIKAVFNKIKANRLFGGGQKRAASGDYLGSLALYDKGISLTPKNPFLYLHKAISLEKLYLYEEAIVQVNKAISIDDNKHAFFLYLGIFKFDSEDYVEATDAFDVVLKHCAGHPLALSYKNLINVVNGKDAKKSLENIKKNIASNNSDFSGRFLVKCEKFLFEKASTTLSFEDCITPEVSKRNSLLSNISYSIDKIICKSRFFLNSDKKAAYLSQVEARKNIIDGNLELAIENHKQSLKHKSTLISAQEGLIGLILANKMYDHFKEIVDNEPSFKDTYKALCNRKINDKEKVLIESILRSNPSIVMNLGRYYFGVGEYNKAFFYFDNLAANREKNYCINYYCGLCKIATGNLHEAFVWFKKSINNINPKIAEKRLEELLKICV